MTDEFVLDKGMFDEVAEVQELPPEIEKELEKEREAAESEKKSESGE